MWILDRIEGDRAVIETDQGGLELPRQQLPPDAKEGDVLCSTAQGILDARANHPDSSFADMYGEHMYLYPDLLEAHRANDRATLRAYGFPVKITEPDCVAELMKRYEALTSN